MLGCRAGNGFNRIVDVIFTGAADVAHAQAAIVAHRCIAAQHSFHRVGYAIQLAAVDSIGRACAHAACSHVGDFVAGCIDTGFGEARAAGDG